MELTEITTRKDITKVLASRGLTGVGLEVGVLRGEFSRSILQNWPGKLYMVDAWRQFEENVDINNGNHMEQLYNFSETFKAVYEFKGRAAIIREASEDAAKLFADESLDFVYIDAAHDYVNTKKDLETWFPKVKKRGLFCGDDYLDGILLHAGATLFEVKRAVDEFAGKNGLKVVESLFYGEYPQWWCIK